MKAPKYGAVTMQAMADAGLNPFAAQLMAEAHADKPDRFGDETIMVMARAHNGTPVFMLISTRQPTMEQFKDWPTTEDDSGRAVLPEPAAETIQLSDTTQEGG